MAPEVETAFETQLDRVRDEYLSGRLTGKDLAAAITRLLRISGGPDALGEVAATVEPTSKPTEQHSA